MHQFVPIQLRGAKTVLIDLPDDAEQREQEKMSPDEVRKSMLKKGINPYKEVTPRRWEEHHITYQSFCKSTLTHFDRTIIGRKVTMYSTAPFRCHHRPVRAVRKRSDSNELGRNQETTTNRLGAHQASVHPQLVERLKADKEEGWVQRF